MKKKLIITAFALLVISNIVLAITSISYKNKMNSYKNQISKVYKFDGENEEIKISNGLIVVSPQKTTIIGGDIQYNGPKKQKVQSYTKTLYLNKQGNKDSLLIIGVSTGAGVNFPDEFAINKSIGEISGGRIFFDNDLKNITNNLYFSIDYSSIFGPKGSSTVKLNVHEVDMNEVK